MWRDEPEVVEKEGKEKEKQGGSLLGKDFGTVLEKSALLIVSC